MASKRKEKSASSAGNKNFLRNVKNDEVLGMISQPDFTVPEGIEAYVWTAAVESVRRALAQLDLDLEIGEGKSYMPKMCRDVDQHVRETDGVSNELLGDSTVKRVREEIGLRLQIRIRLGRSPEGLRALIALLKRQKGKINSEDWGDHTTPIGKIKFRCYGIVGAFGDTATRRKLAWDLIAKFLSELSGETVEFIDKEYRDARRSPGSADEMPVKPRRKFVLPEGLSLDQVDETENAMPRNLLRLRTHAIALSANLQLQIDEIDQHIKACNLEKVRIEKELAATQRDLEPYEAEARRMDEKYAGILRALQTLHGDLKELPRDHQRRKDEELEQLGAPYRHTLEQHRVLQAERTAIIAKIELLELKRAEFIALKKTVTTMLAGFATLQILGTPVAETANAPDDPEKTDDDEDDDPEPETDETRALEAVRELARWFSNLNESIKSWPVSLGYKVVRDAGRVDDLIAQLERLLAKKTLMLDVVTDARFNGMLNTFSLDLQGMHPAGASIKKGGRQKDRGSINMERLGTLIGILREYEEAA